jgi:hypothetical protein
MREGKGVVGGVLMPFDRRRGRGKEGRGGLVACVGHKWWVVDGYFFISFQMELN